MRHIRTSLILLLTLIFILAGCSKEELGTSIENEKIIVYTTLFPLYDFTRQIGGEHVEVHNIIPTGVEPHDFEPSAKDIVAINEADLFIYNGAGYESWVNKVIQNISSEGPVVLDASVGVTLLPIDDHESHEEEDEHAEHDHTQLGKYDPHTWLDPTNAMIQAEQILQALKNISPEHKDEFQLRYDKFVAQLKELDEQYKDVLRKATKSEIIVSHQAFGYLAARYGFTQIPISGLSPSSEPGTREVQRLIELVKEHDLRYVAFDALVESKVAKMVQRETGAEAVTLYTIENATKEQMKQGVTYLDLMKENLQSLKKVLEVR